MGLTRNQKRTRNATLKHTGGKPIHRKRNNLKRRRPLRREATEAHPTRAPRMFFSPSTSVRVLHRGDLEILISTCLRLEKQPPSPRGQFSGDRKVWEFFRGLKRDEPEIWNIIERIKRTYSLGEFSKFSIIDALPKGTIDQAWHEDAQPEGCYNFQISLCEVCNLRMCHSAAFLLHRLTTHYNTPPFFFR
jgi:hypothetical protein